MRHLWPFMYIFHHLMADNYFVNIYETFMAIHVHLRSAVGKTQLCMIAPCMTTVPSSIIARGVMIAVGCTAFR